MPELLFLLSQMDDAPAQAGYVPPSSFQSIPESVYGLSVHIHEGFWPFHRVATLSTAFNVLPQYRLMDKGSGKLSISKSDPAYTGGLITRGRILVIDPPSTYRTPEWIGPIIDIQEQGNQGVVNISAEDYFKVLDVKTGRLTDEYTASAASIVHQVIRLKNAEHHTGVYLPARFPIGAPSVTMPVGGQSILQTAKEASQRSDWEYGLVSFVTPSRLRVEFFWDYRVGVDAFNYVHILDAHIVDYAYSVNAAAVRESVTAVGGTGRISSGSRKSVTRTASRIHGPMTGDISDPASEAYIRETDIPASLRTEYVVYRPLVTAYDELSREALVELERPSGSAEKLDLTLNQAFDWSLVHIGDYVRVNADMIGPSGINRKMRVMSMEPNWELGVLKLLLHTPVN